MLISLLSLPTLTIAKDWWIVKVGQPCTLAKTDKVDLSPEAFLQNFPACSVSHNDGINMGLDCTNTSLKTNFLFTSSKNVCEKFQAQEKNKKEESKRVAKFAKSSKVSKVAWWIVSEKAGCLPAEGWMHPDSITKAHPKCFKDKNLDLAEGLMVLDCQKSELRNTIVFSSKYPLCLKAVEKMHSIQSQNN